MLQVWTAGNEPRIAAFNVGKSCQLICPGYGYLGLNNVTSMKLEINDLRIHKIVLFPKTMTFIFILNAKF
jgi:hypothetical protein